MLAPIVFGAVLGGLLVMAARTWSRSERRVLAIGLVIAALIYLGFSLFPGADSPSLQLEASGVAIFGFLAWLGFRRSLWWLAAGWLAHVAWDVGLHLDRLSGGVPGWYPLLCVGFDLVVVGYLLGALAFSGATTHTRTGA